MSERCPNCSYDGVEREAFRAGRGAGDEVVCSRCKATLLIEEHSNGWQDWMTFELVDQDEAP